jgi:hypothetical protein
MCCKWWPLTLKHTYCISDLLVWYRHIHFIVTWWLVPRTFVVTRYVIHSLSLMTCILGISSNYSSASCCLGTEHCSNLIGICSVAEAMLQIYLVMATVTGWLYDTNLSDVCHSLTLLFMILCSTMNDCLAINRIWLFVNGLHFKCWYSKWLLLFGYFLHYLSVGWLSDNADIFILTK